MPSDVKPKRTEGLRSQQWFGRQDRDGFAYRSWLKGRGLPHDQFDGRPVIGICNTYSELTPCNSHFRTLAEHVKTGVHEAGVNALSSRLVVEVRNRGHLWRQSFQLGDPDGDLEQVRPLEDGEGTGTTVTYWASTDTFETTTYNLETITTRIREYAFLNKGLEIVVRDERPSADQVAEAVEDDTVADSVDQAGSDAIKRGEDGGIEQVFRYDRGLVDYVEHLNRRKEKANPTVINFEAETPESSESHMSLEVAMQWNRTFTESVHTFANTINTHEGGTHEEGFRSALTTLINNGGFEWGLMKKQRGPRLR